MLIETRMRAPNVLYIEAYTFSIEEWTALEEILDRSGISFRYSPLDRDELGRGGRRYVAETSQQIETLARLLQGRFGSEGRFEPSFETGRRYACREIRRSGMGNGCQEFVAPDDRTAIVRCGIIASQRRWLGGDAKQGSCRGHALFGLFERLRSMFANRYLHG
jgi:hypothetical protein